MAPGQRCLLGQQSEGCCLQVPEQRGVPGARKEGERGRQSESVAADTTEDGPEGRGQEQGARRGIQKSMAGARSTWGQRGPFSSDLRPLQHEGLRAPGAAPGLALKVSPRVTWSLPTPHSSFPATPDAPFPQQVTAFALAVPTAWGGPPSALPSDTTYPATLWPP